MSDFLQTAPFCRMHSDLNVKNLDVFVYTLGVVCGVTILVASRRVLDNVLLPAETSLDQM